MKTIKTTLHTYNFDLTIADEKTQWENLKSKFKGSPRMIESHGGGGHYHPFTQLDGETITLETSHLFDNQWNTTAIIGISEKGLRVFDFAKDYPSRLSGCPVNVARGHYLEQTTEMLDIRNNTLKCGYCGAMEPGQKGHIFCPHCLGSEYLTEDLLHLTRLLPVSKTNNKRQELTEREKAHLIPLYIEAQTKAGHERNNKRAMKKRQCIKKKYEKTKKLARIEYEGFLWLMDNDVDIDNCIYYSHSNLFCFGWRSPVSDPVRSALLDILVEFPFNYEIK